jgi:hypothetical protein
MSETTGEHSGAKPPRFILPPNTLKKKVGEGGIPAEKLTLAQNFIKANQVDFAPQGRSHLDKIVAYIAQSKQAAASKLDLSEKIILEVMQLKAHGGMFHYGLITLVSDVALQFMEKIKTIDDDVVAILNAFDHTVRVILDNEMRGEGGEEGMALAWELDQACNRYYKRHKTAS